MMFAVLSFSASQWLWPAIVVVAVLAIVLSWSYRTAGQAGPVRWVCLGLKLAGVAALALCLLEPLWLAPRVKPGANFFAVLADNSQGLQVKDRGETRSRGESLRAQLDSGAVGWQSALADSFEVRRYLFDARLQATPDFGELDFNGRSSAIAGALRTVQQRFQGRPLAGVLLFTDGNATDVRGSLPPIDGLPPVYPVVVGRPGAVRDVAVQQVIVSQTAFEDAPVSIQAEVTAAGLAGRPLFARLVDQQGKVLQEQTQTAPRDGGVLPFRFTLRAGGTGLAFHQLQVGLADGPQGEAGVAEEATQANNTRVLVVDRGRGPHRILYVAGRPNWEFKFLNRALQEDTQVQLVGLIRVAKREPKFDFRGRAGETSNPLYRGFGDQSAEEVQRYDQPVLVRLNTRDELELRAGFPRTPEDLYGYQAVIIDDLEAEFFSPDQAQVLQKFVSERGGGLLMLGGMESFQAGGYQRTPIGEVLPVYLDRTDGPEGPIGTEPPALQFDLAREGWLQPWARLFDHEQPERARLEGMPPFQVVNRVRGAKPGASVIATGRDESGVEVPLLAVQSFGRGRTGALMVGDFWRWGTRDADRQVLLGKAWRQLARWLVTDVPEKVELHVEPLPEDAHATVKLEVRVRDNRFQPVDNAAVTIEVEPVTFTADSTRPSSGPAEEAGKGAGRLRLRAEADPSEPGLYVAHYVPRVNGGFRATAIALNAAGAELGRAESGWSSDLAAEEFRSLSPNLAFLEGVARQTGGAVIAAEKLGDFVRSLPDRAAPVMETTARPLWHTAAMFAFALVCLSAEWGLRRWKGLP